MVVLVGNVVVIMEDAVFIVFVVAVDIVDRMVGMTF